MNNSILPGREYPPKASIVAGFDLAEILMLTVGVLVIAAIVYVV